MARTGVKEHATGSYAVPASTFAIWPEYILFSSTDVCPLKCVQCPHSMTSKGWKHSSVAPAKIRTLFAHAKTASLHGAGEVFTNPRLWDYIPSSDSLDLGFVTNGQMFTNRNINRLLERGIKWLDISIDAGTLETYRKIRGASWAKLWSGVAAVRKRREGSSFPRLCANMTLMRDNVAEVSALIDLLAENDFERLHVFHLNPLAEAEAWKVEFHNGSGTFDYHAQNCLRPENKEAHDVALLSAIKTAKARRFKLLGSGAFFGRQGAYLPLHEF